MATKSGNTPALTITQNVCIAQQITRAMDHLAAQRMVHKDLAARNCLITSTLVVKVGLPRMTKEPYSQEYCKHVNQVIFKFFPILRLFKAFLLLYRLFRWGGYHTRQCTKMSTLPRVTCTHLLCWCLRYFLKESCRTPKSTITVSWPSWRRINWSGKAIRLLQSLYKNYR